MIHIVKRLQPLSIPIDRGLRGRSFSRSAAQPLLYIFDECCSDPSLSLPIIKADKGKVRKRRKMWRQCSAADSGTMTERCLLRRLDDNFVTGLRIDISWIVQRRKI